MTVCNIWVDHVDRRARVAVDSSTDVLGESMQRSKLYTVTWPPMLVTGRGLSRLPVAAADALWLFGVQTFDDAVDAIDAHLPTIMDHFITVTTDVPEARARVLSPCTLYAIGWSPKAQRMQVVEWTVDGKTISRNDLTGGVTAPYDAAIDPLRSAWPDVEQIVRLARAQVTLGRRTGSPAAFGGDLVVGEVDAAGVSTRVVCRL